MTRALGAQAPEPFELKVLRLALDHGLASASDTRDGAVKIEQLAATRPVMRLESPTGTTYWKVGRRVRGELRACRNLDAAGCRDLHPEVIVEDRDIAGFAAVAGLELGQVSTADAIENRIYWNLGRLLARLEAVPTKGEGAVQEYLAPPLEWARELSSAQLGVIAEIQNSTVLQDSLRHLETLPRAFTHGDVRPENVIVDEQDVSLIDWELARARWRSFDLSTALAHIVWQRLLPAFREGSGSTMNRVRASAPTREVCAQLVDGFGRIDEHVHLAIAFALAHLAFELAATAPRLTEGATFLLDTATLVASEERQWRLLLLPLDR